MSAEYDPFAALGSSLLKLPLYGKSATDLTPSIKGVYPKDRVPNLCLPWIFLSFASAKISLWMRLQHIGP